jgi:hypothetical protein
MNWIGGCGGGGRDVCRGGGGGSRRGCVRMGVVLVSLVLRRGCSWLILLAWASTSWTGGWAVSHHSMNVKNVCNDCESMILCTLHFVHCSHPDVRLLLLSPTRIHNAG